MIPLGTATQLLAIALYLLPLDSSLHTVRVLVLVVAVALTVYSGLDYFLHARSRVEASP